MEVFIINEWLWSDINGDNEDKGPRQVEASIFLGAFSKSDHQFIMVLGSKFEQKAMAACRSRNPGVQRLAVLFFSFRYDLSHCRLLRMNELAKLPHDLAASVKDDDHYLVRALLTVKDSILVTTDGPLLKALEGLASHCISREEFLRDYFGISS